MNLGRCLATAGVLTLLSVRALTQAPAYEVAVAPDGSPYVKGHVLVGFHGGVLPAIQLGERLFGGTVARLLPEIGVALIAYPVEHDVFPIIRTVSADPRVRFAEPDYILHTAFTPNDTYWANQWGPKKIRCEVAWDYGQGDAGTVIAIVDTGINYNHPDLNDKYVGGYDFHNGDNDPMDDNGHGTHCAGIAAAETNNATGVAGVGFNCKLMAVKVLGSNGSGTLTNVASGINYATSNGAKVINLSLGSTSSSSTLQSAVDNAWNSGAVVCCAAGNNGSTSLFYPAAYPNAIAVASTDSNDARSSFSNYGASWVDVAAPGRDIYSTYGSGYAYLSGTSMASPHVAGAAALLYSKIGGARSNATATQVRNLLESTAVYVGTWVASGRIDLGAAMAQLGGGGGQTLTFDATSVVRLIGNMRSANPALLHDDDNQFLQVSAVKSGSSRVTSYYAEYVVSSAAWVSGVIELSARASRTAGLTVQAYNWPLARWETVLSGVNLTTTEAFRTINFPSPMSDYISSSNQVRVLVRTSSGQSHTAYTDLLQIKLTSQ